MKENLMAESFVLFDLEAENQQQVMKALAEAMDQEGRLLDKEGYVEDVKSREAQASTAVGMNIATPHAKSVHVKTPSLGFARLMKPIQWDDNEMVDLVFQIAVPSPGQGYLHLKIISSLFRKMVYPDFLEKLRGAESPEEVMGLIGQVS